MLLKTVKYGLLLPAFLLGSATGIILLSLNRNRVKKSTKLPPQLPLAGFYASIFVALRYGFRTGWVAILTAKACLFFINYHAWRFRIVGITGGVGCGKTTASNILAQKPTRRIVNCEQICYDLAKRGQPAYHEIIKAFGDAVLDHDTQQINRFALAHIELGDRYQGAQLNRILTKHFGLTLMLELFQRLINGEKLVVLDTSILFESRVLPKLCDPIIVVYISDQVKQIKRMADRDPIYRDSKKALKKIDSQMSQSERLERADIKISNDGNQNELKDLILNAIKNEGL